MSIYGELDPMPEHKTQFVFNGKREHKTKVNISNLEIENQHIDIEITQALKDYVVVEQTIKITLFLTCSQQKNMVLLTMWVENL